MAEAKKKPEESQDQSMEEILQSIRRIIAEESDEIKVDNPPPQTAEAAPFPMEKRDEGTSDISGSDVLELTDMVTEDGTVINLKDHKPEVHKTEMNPASGPQQDAPDVLSSIDQALAVPEAQINKAASTIPSVQKGEPLLSRNSADAVSAAMKNLIGGMAEEVTQTALVSLRADMTVEQLISEAIRPLLKQWLDTHLPAIVERVVEREVKRLAGK